MDELDSGRDEFVVWSPQSGPQEALVHCPITLVGYGGARGGGKTDGVLGKFAVKQEQLGEAFNAIFFRKELPQADDLIERAKQIYLPLKAHWQDQKKQFTFPGGGRLRFRPLANDGDAEKYQGQNLCVAVGTPIRMADGTFKPIEQIQVGDMVATLLGPRRIKHVTTPYLAPCVENQVLAQDGTEVGRQKNPIWHPVLTAHGVFSTAGDSEQHKSLKRHIDEQSRLWALSACNADRIFPAYKGLKHQAWFACLEDGKTYCKESLDDNPTLQQLPTLSVPVALHAPTVRLKQKHEHYGHDESTESHAQGKSGEQLLDSCPIKQKIWRDFERPDAPFRPLRDLPLQLGDAPSCEQTNFYRALGSQADYQFFRDLYDAHIRLEAKIDQGEFPLQGGAAELYRTSNEDELGTTQTHSPVPTEWWVHPYSGKAFHLAEDVVFGKMVMTYIGEHLVTDLTVEEANHYISDCGLINKNSDCAIEEAGNYGEPSCIWKLFGALRGKGGGQIILTFNPGGVGHHWLKEFFIKPAPKGMKMLQKKLPNGKHFDYIYIPSRVHDNQILLAKDPEYIDRLHMVGSPELVRAWLEGDFEIHEGSYFPEFSSKHIISPFNVPKHWPRYLGYDWGYRSPFAAVWGAVSSGRDDNGNEVPYPKGAIVIYREMHGKGIDNEQQADRIASASVGEGVVAVADPSIFSHDGGPSINDQFNKVFAKYQHPSFRRADNDRISGWSQIRQRLVHKPEPLLYIFATCPYLLETLPSLAIDKRKPEDADTTGADHACLTGDTLVVTKSGKVPIKELDGVKTHVLSHDGQFHLAFGSITNKRASIIRLEFEDNSVVEATPDHRFMLADGMFKITSSLTLHDLIQCVTYAGENNIRQDSGVSRREVLPVRSVFQQAVEKLSRLNPFAQKSLGVLSRQDSQGQTYPSQGSQQGQQSNRESGIAGCFSSFKSTHDRGTKTGSCTESDKTCSSKSKILAQIATGARMALRTCKASLERYAYGDAGMPVLPDRISDEIEHEKQKQVLSPKLQNGGTTKKIKSITYTQTQKEVYCLNVPDTSTFVLGNGIVSHNCDALRYLCKARLIDAKWEQAEAARQPGVIVLADYVNKVRKRQKQARI